MVSGLQYAVFRREEKGSQESTSTFVIPVPLLRDDTPAGIQLLNSPLIPPCQGGRVQNLTADGW